jgi:hypothetical protein
MDLGLQLLVLLVKVAFFVLLLGWIPALIAKKKGRNFFLWWIYGGAFFIIALIHSLCLKRSAQSEEFPMEKSSKILMITLIVIGIILWVVIILFVIIAGIVCYVKKDEVVKYGTTTLVTSVKTKMNENPTAGIDTTRVNAIADAFIRKFNETEIDYDKYGRFGQEIQGFQSDEYIDSADAELFMQALIEYFPELQELIPEVEIEDTTYQEDSVSIE